MDLKELKKFSEENHEKIKSKLNLDEKGIILAHCVKLGEEVGELNEEILDKLNCQMREKNKDKRDLEGEFGDVLMVLGVLAESLDIDLEQALKYKMEIVNKRFHGEID